MANLPSYHDKGCSFSTTKLLLLVTQNRTVKKNKLEARSPLEVVLDLVAREEAPDPGRLGDRGEYAEGSRGERPCRVETLLRRTKIHFLFCLYFVKK